MRLLNFRFALVSIAVTMVAPIALAAWVPIPCEERTAEVKAVRERAGAHPDPTANWRRYEQDVRGAEPGDPKYVPHPFPRTPDQVFEDFRYAFLNRLVTDPLNIAERHRGTYDALSRGEVQFKVERVENWTPARCSEDRPIPFYHLVRLFDGEEEISRAAIHASGLFAVYSALDGGEWPLDDLSEVESIVLRRFGIETKPTQAQYVFLDGLPGRCSPVMPCVAFQSGSTMYLANGELYLFAIDHDAPHRSILEMMQGQHQRPPSLHPDQADRPWISLGFGARQGRLVAVGPKGQPLD
jgi:hypothetical protein